MGDFEINLEIQSLNGKYVSFLLNQTVSCKEATLFGWRNFSEWTSIKIIRTDSKVEVFFNDSKKPQIIKEYSKDNLLFIMRFNGLKEINTLKYKNLKIFADKK